MRLKALLPMWMPWIRKRFRVRPEIEKQMLKISPRQIDRRLQAQKGQRKRRIYGRTKPGYLLKHQIPVKTDSWDVSTPGFTEVDLVSHSGNSADGEFAHTLNVTDIHTTWTESRAVLGKGQTAVKEALNEVEGALPFRLLGVDSDNGSEFINWHLKKWCEAKTDPTDARAALQEGRQRARGAEELDACAQAAGLGALRFTHEAVEAMNDLYRHELRLWLNLFLPSVKLVKKARVGSKVRRVYDAPQTPLERVASSPQANSARVAELKNLKNLYPLFVWRRKDQKVGATIKFGKPGLTRESQIMESRRGKGCGKAAPGKSNNRISPPLGNPAQPAGFPLSHSHDGGAPPPSVTSQMARQPRLRLHS